MYLPAPEEIIRKCLRIELVCEKWGIKLASAALQFPLRGTRGTKPNDSKSNYSLVACVLTGVKNEAEINYAIEATNENIPEEFWEELRQRDLI